MRILTLILGITLAGAFNPTFAQQANKSVAAVAGFYNLENLFDTIDDPNIKDEEYLASGDRQWTEERYTAKLNQLSKVLNDMRVDILGVSEIENRRVLEDLIKNPLLKKFKYEIVHFDSPDYRGIDVGVLYRPGAFNPYSSKAYPVIDTLNSKFKTRDILLVSGTVRQKDTIHFMVNHWPSRRGGGSDSKRVLAATVARQVVDSLMETDPDAKIIITGDFNDDPRNRSLKKVLKADIKMKEKDQLYNASYPMYKEGYGTLYYNGAYNLFDQIIISQSLLNGKDKSVRYQDGSFTIAAKDYMRSKDQQNLGAPLRTFSRGKYLNGYSDHFPVFIILEH